MVSGRFGLVLSGVKVCGPIAGTSTSRENSRDNPILSRSMRIYESGRLSFQIVESGVEM
jgi:hypothetical protein